MKQVLKWPLVINDDEQAIGGGQVALVAVQEVGDHLMALCVWTVEDADPVPKRKVRVFGTGHRVPDGAAFVGSAMMPPFVWHVFDVTVAR